MLEASNVYLPLDAALPSCAGMAQAELAHALGIRYADITSWKFSKLSVDARRKNDVHFTASFVFEVADQEIEEALAGKRTKTKIQVKRHVPYEGYRVGEWLGGDARPIVVGMGPAGLFAAWALAKSGAAPIVLERGEDVDARMASVNSFKEGGALNPESNVQFGEGGAGTFSDGKLTTNIKNPRCRDVLHIFAQAGAPEEILWEGKPHIGTDKLVNVVKTMREQIIAWGGEVRFGARFEGMEFEDGRIVAVRGSQRQEDGTREKFVLPASDVVLACGHSARDVFDRVRNAGLLMERKPFAVGVRIEHPQKLIDKAQYGNAAGHPALGAADYKMAVHLRNDRSVYTFCMCPGGEVMCSASELGGVVVNGASRHDRNGRNANAALLVNVEDRDLRGDDVLAGVKLQRRMETAAYRAAGESYKAPAQRVGDFMASAGKFNRSQSEHRSRLEVEPTYARGVEWVDLNQVLPPFVARSLHAAIPLFNGRIRGFSDPNAVLTGVETRSSSPVRIVRDKVTCQALFSQTTDCGLKIADESAGVAAASRTAEGEPIAGGFYPCGEGAGYAGGIMSAAVDGLRVAEAIIASYE